MVKDNKIAKKGNSSDDTKPLSCFFLPDVLCSYRKTEKFYVMDRCVKCRHYNTFMSEMEEEEDRFFEEVERIRRGEPY